MTDIDDEYLEMANDYFTYVSRKKELLKEKKEMENEMKSLKEKLARYMDAHSIEEITTEKGSLVMVESKSKPSAVNKVKLIEHYQKSMDAGMDPNNPEEMSESIFSLLPQTTKKDIKAKAARKSKAKKMKSR